VGSSGYLMKGAEDPREGCAEPKRNLKGNFDFEYLGVRKGARNNQY